MAVGIFPISLGFDQCYVLKSEGVIAVDAGFPGKGEHFAQGLKRASINPHDVQLIDLTHGHWDHIGSAKDIKNITGGKLAMHHREASWLEQSIKPLPPGITLWGKVFIGIHKLFMPLITITPVEVDVLLGDEGLSLADYGIPLNRLFSIGFRYRNLDRYGEGIEFFCPDLKRCRVDPTREPIYTPYTGEKGSTLMAVAEAPSASNGVGPFCGGLFADVERHLDMKASPVNLVLHFVRHKYGFIPHFTDVVKCGLAKQSDRRLLKKRFGNCRERFLVNEIKILKPEIILCFGRTAERNVNKVLKNLPPGKQEVKYLLHYSRNNNRYHKNCDKCIFEIWNGQLGGARAVLKNAAKRACPHKAR
jgi:hypothetical protein